MNCSVAEIRGNVMDGGARLPSIDGSSAHRNITSHHTTQYDTTERYAV